MSPTNLSGPSPPKRRLDNSALLPEPTRGVHHIELKLQNVNQLFNTMDPSPFHQKDLDDDATEFILSWAQEYHRRDPVGLIVHLEKLPEDHGPQPLVENAVHHYFAYRARLNALEFKRLMKRGQLSLLVGMLFLAACFLLIELLGSRSSLGFPGFFKEGLTIAGWVAMWRPPTRLTINESLT